MVESKEMEMGLKSPDLNINGYRTFPDYTIFLILRRYQDGQAI